MKEEKIMPITLISDTGYKYDPIYRFYGCEYADEIKPIKPCGAATLGKFYLACRKSWSFDTCSPDYRHLWSAENNAAGQCTISSILVHEYFGGEILNIPGEHTFNRIDGKIVDITSEQFGHDAVIDMSGAVVVDPVAFSAGSTTGRALRLEMLRALVLKALEK